jgi:hypothetical protein
VAAAGVRYYRAGDYYADEGSEAIGMRARGREGERARELVALSL